MSAIGVGCISTSTGSSLGQILTESSLGQPSFEGGQLGGCMEESEPIGDHMMRGEGLVPTQQGRGISLKGSLYYGFLGVLRILQRFLFLSPVMSVTLIYSGKVQRSEY